MKRIASPEKTPELLPGATAIWWEVRRYAYDIQPLQVIRETEKTLREVYDWSGKRNERTTYKNVHMFPTWEEARAHALALAKNSADSHELRLNEERAAVRILEKLKAPTP